MPSKPTKRRGGSGSDQPAARSETPSSSNTLLIGIAAVVLVLVGIGAAVVVKGGGSSDAPPPAAPVEKLAAPVEDPFVGVPRAGADLGGDDVASFPTKLGDDTFTLAYPKNFVIRVVSFPEGKKFTFKGPEKSALVWAIGAPKDSVTTADLLRDLQLDGARTGVKPQSQRLGSVVGSGERFTIASDPDPLEGIVLRAPYGTDREIVGLGVAPATGNRRAVIDAMLGSLRSSKLEGIKASGGVTFLPK